MKRWNWLKNDEQNTSRTLTAQNQNAGNFMAPSAFFAPISHFYQDMDRMFEQAFRNFGMPSIYGGGMPGMMFTPKVDIASTDREYTVDVEVPGMREEDININVTRDGQLRISGEKRLENEKQEKDFHRVECAYGSFSRTLTLPEDADLDNIEAQFNNGLLTITAPRLESQNAQTRRIEISSAGGRGQGARRQGGQEARQDNAPGAGTPKRAA